MTARQRDRSILSAPWRWSLLALRVARLWPQGRLTTPQLLCRSYDAAAPGYDQAWTHGMRDFTTRMLQHLQTRPQDECLDLTCGTGFVTAFLRSRVTGRVTGVDASGGMIAVARDNAPGCDFVQADALAFLRAAPACSADVVTCAWGLGYSRPAALLHEAARVLRPGGRVGVIDNSLSSLREMVWASVRTFALEPQALQHVLRVRFLRNSRSLCRLLLAAGLQTLWHEDGERTFTMPTGHAAIARLRATGAAAGFEFAAEASRQDRIYDLFARQLERRWGSAIPVTHRYLAAVARKDAAC